jgi:hypothetical protein
MAKVVIKHLEIKEGYNGFVVFENGDGTNYTMIVTPDPYGGYIFIVNNNSAYRVYDDDYEVKFLFGNKNPYTEKAVNHIARSLI